MCRNDEALGPVHVLRLPSWWLAIGGVATVCFEAFGLKQMLWHLASDQRAAGSDHILCWNAATLGPVHVLRLPSQWQASSGVATVCFEAFSLKQVLWLLASGQRAAGSDHMLCWIGGTLGPVHVLQLPSQ